MANKNGTDNHDAAYLMYHMRAEINILPSGTGRVFVLGRVASKKISGKMSRKMEKPLIVLLAIISSFALLNGMSFCLTAAGHSACPHGTGVSAQCPAAIVCCQLAPLQETASETLVAVGQASLMIAFILTSVLFMPLFKKTLAFLGADPRDKPPQRHSWQLI